MTDGRYGYRQATGLWDGMIGELMRKVCHSRLIITDYSSLNEIVFVSNGLRAHGKELNVHSCNIDQHFCLNNFTRDISCLFGWNAFFYH